MCLYVPEKHSAAAYSTHDNMHGSLQYLSERFILANILEHNDTTGKNLKQLKPKPATGSAVSASARSHGIVDHSQQSKPLASEASNRKHFDFENILHSKSKSTTIRFFVSLGPL